MFRSFLTATLLTLTILGVSLVGAPGRLSAQTQPSYGAATIHPHTITLPARSFYRGESKFTLELADSASGGFSDTLMVPGYDSTCTVLVNRKSVSARAPGVLDNHPYITHGVQARNMLILNFAKPDTLTLDVAIRKPY
jgi:hypothetical protein